MPGAGGEAWLSPSASQGPYGPGRIEPSALSRVARRYLAAKLAESALWTTSLPVLPERGSRGLLGSALPFRLTIWRSLKPIVAQVVMNWPPLSSSRSGEMNRFRDIWKACAGSRMRPVPSWLSMRCRQDFE